MHADGVRAVVNTCEEYVGPVAQYQHHGIEQLRIPTTDFTHPKLDGRAARRRIHSTPCEGWQHSLHSL